MGLVYSLDMVPPEDVGLAWDLVILPYFAQRFKQSEYPNVWRILDYVEKAYIG